MKFMKLGSKPDAFQSEGNDIRFVASELPTDVTIHIGEVRFYLHKFPILSKSTRLQRLLLKASEGRMDEVAMHDFPGGPMAFEICAKFCYGMTVTLNPYNVLAARCAAEYLEMTEDVEKGNLIYKIEVFLNSSIFHSWKDSIIVLKTTKSLIPWSEELKVVGRCIDCIASKISIDPANVNLSYTHSKNSATSDEIVETEQRSHRVPNDWWVEDVCELDVDLYKRVMVAVRSKGRMSSDMLGEALKAYTVRWLPDSYDALVADDYTKKNRVLVETIIHLLPSEKGSGCSCRFLLNLLKVVNLIGAEDQLKEELMNRISEQLHKASVKDLLIPAGSTNGTIYDVYLVQTLTSKCMKQFDCSRDAVSNEKDDKGFYEYPGNGPLLTLGKLIDGYLAEIASDPKLTSSSFLELSKSIPEGARPIHDDLYTAIDIYLKEHPELPKAEKKIICGLLDVKKFSPDASIHAAQNERLPLRMVVQVLFFDQVRAAVSDTGPIKDISLDSSESKANVEEDWDARVLRKQLGSLKLKNECENIDRKQTNSINKDKDHGLLQPSKSRRIFDKLWASKGQGETSRSSETSGSSQSPPTSVKPTDLKASGSSSRHRRYSVS